MLLKAHHLYGPCNCRLSFRLQIGMPRVKIITTLCRPDCWKNAPTQREAARALGAAVHVLPQSFLDPPPLLFSCLQIQLLANTLAHALWTQRLRAADLGPWSHTTFFICSHVTATFRHFFSLGQVNNVKNYV